MVFRVVDLPVPCSNKGNDLCLVHIDSDALEGVNGPIIGMYVFNFEEGQVFFLPQDAGFVARQPCRSVRFSVPLLRFHVQVSLNNGSISLDLCGQSLGNLCPVVQHSDQF